MAGCGCGGAKEAARQTPRETRTPDQQRRGPLPAFNDPGFTHGSPPPYDGPARQPSEKTTA